MYTAKVVQETETFSSVIFSSSHNHFPVYLRQLTAFCYALLFSSLLLSFLSACYTSANNVERNNGFIIIITEYKHVMNGDTK